MQEENSGVDDAFERLEHECAVQWALESATLTVALGFCFQPGDGGVEGVEGEGGTGGAVVFRIEAVDGADVGGLEPVHAVEGFEQTRAGTIEEVMCGNVGVGVGLGIDVDAGVQRLTEDDLDLEQKQRGEGDEGDGGEEGHDRREGGVCGWWWWWWRQATEVEGT